MVTTEYAVDLDKGFRNSIQEAIDAVGDLTVPLSIIRASWFRSNNAIFALKGPGKYQDLSTGYKIRKQKKYGFVYPILKATGTLAASLTQPGDKNAISKIEDKVALVLGTSVSYGIYHQSKEPRRKLPRREFIFLGAEQTAPDAVNNRREAWIKIIEDFVVQKIGAK